MQHSTSTGHPIPQEHREALRRLIDAVGEAQAGELLGVSRSTLPRALAGLGVQRGTAVLIEMRLAQGLETGR